MRRENEEALGCLIVDIALLIILGLILMLIMG